MPDQPLALTNLGAISLANRQYEKCIQFLTKSLSLNANQHIAEFNLGNAYSASNRPEEVIASYLRSIAISSDYYHAYVNLGNSYLSILDNENALMSYEAAIQLDIENPLAHYNKGIILKNSQKFDDAITSFHLAIKYQPDHFDAYKNIADIFQMNGQDEDALSYYQKSIAINENHAESHNNYALLLHQMDHFEQALNSYIQAISLNPNFAAAFNNSAMTLRAMRHYDDALNNYERSIAIDNNPLAKFNKSLLQLGLGDYANRFVNYENRWFCSTSTNTFRSFNKPRWTGEQNLSGKTIFVYSEQGLGDVIQFSRYILLLNSLGASVIFETPSSLVKVLSSLSPSIKVVDKQSNIQESEFDYFSPLLSLPLAFRTDINSIPYANSYLSVSSELIDQFKLKIGQGNRPRIGIVWSTISPPSLKQSRSAVIDKHDRSIPLNQLSCLFDLPFDFYSLQKEITDEDAATLNNFSNLHHFTETLNDFTDTAALAHNMDLIISIDTSTVHLAAALGLNVFVLVNYVSDFRWLLNRNDSPWYQTCTLFRQESYRDWSIPLEQIKSHLTITP